MSVYAERPWIDSYEPGVSPELDIPEYPLFHLLEESAAKYPENTALIFKGRNISFRELNELADAVAAGLAANGFKKGDRAVIYMVNMPQFVISFFGILKAGGIVIATNPLYTARELEHQLADCGAETVFVMSLYYDLLKKVQAGGNTKVKRVIVTNIKEYLPTHLRLLFTLVKEKKDGHRISILPGDMWFQDFLAAGKQAPKPEVKVEADDVALLQYTGGTTGLSKGAVALHRNLVANTHLVRAWLTDTAEGEEIWLTAIPLFHSFGMIVAMAFGIMAAGKLVLIPDPRDQADLLSSINKYLSLIHISEPTRPNAPSRMPSSA
mgnify:CR=1 FL=1